MSGGAAFVAFLMILMVILVLTEKNRSVGTWFMALFITISMGAIIYEDTSKNNHKRAVIDHFKSGAAIWCKDNSRGSSKFSKLSSVDGYRFNNELEQFESNSTIIVYFEDSLCDIKGDGR
jgi:hypothetical protein